MTLIQCVGKSWFSIQNKADSSAAEVSIYDTIGFWGVTAKDFQASLKEIPKDRAINLRINSPGGSVFDGFAIFNMLQARREYVTAHIEGLAASMASVVMLSGFKVIISENSFVMIHNAATFTEGDSEDLRKMADVLDKITSTISSAYQKKTGKTEEEVKAAMDEETWFTAQEAKDWGLVDEISGAVEIAASFDLRGFRRVPAAFTAKAEGAPPPAKTTDNKTPIMNKLLSALAVAKLIPSAKLEDDAACDSFEAAFENLTESHKSERSKDADQIKALTEQVTALTAQVEASRKKDAEAFVADLVKTNRIKDDAKRRESLVALYLKDAESAKQWAETFAAAAPSKPAGVKVAGEKIAAEQEEKPKALRGVDLIASAINAQFVK